MFLHHLPCVCPHRAPPGLSLKYGWHRLRREAVVDEGCERSGHSIDCILALISIWLDPPPLQRSGTRGRGISAWGPRGASRGRPVLVEAERRASGWWGGVLCWANDFRSVFNSKVWLRPNCWARWMDKEGCVSARCAHCSTAFSKGRPTVKTALC